jgi:hypothetical protein
MPCVRLRCRREKPRVSAFTSADIPKILALEPDLVLTFSDLQASIAADLIRAGIAVHAFNQRDIPDILAMIRTLGALVAPYVHPRLAAVAHRHTNLDGSPVAPVVNVFIEGEPLRTQPAKPEPPDLLETVTSIPDKPH